MSYLHYCFITTLAYVARARGCAPPDQLRRMGRARQDTLTGEQRDLLYWGDRAGDRPSGTEWFDARWAGRPAGHDCQPDSQPARLPASQPAGRPASSGKYRTRRDAAPLGAASSASAGRPRGALCVHLDFARSPASLLRRNGNRSRHVTSLSLVFQDY